MTRLTSDAESPAAGLDHENDRRQTVGPRSPVRKHNAGEIAAKPDGEPEATDYRHRALVVWEQHPALAILDSEDAVIKPVYTDAHSKPSPSKRAMVGDLETVCIDYEHRVRERLDAIAGEVRRLRDAGTGIAAGTSPAEVPTGTQTLQCPQWYASQHQTQRLD